MPRAATTSWSPRTRRCTRRSAWAEIASSRSRHSGTSGGHAGATGTPSHRSHPGLQRAGADRDHADRSEEHTSELQSHSDLVCRLLLEKKKKKKNKHIRTQRKTDKLK